MVIIYNPTTKNQTNTQTTISPANYDAIRSFAISRASDPIIIPELIQAYTSIATTMNISPAEFVALVQGQGNTQQQDIYLASLLNTVRVRNAVIGVGLNKTTPSFVAREIRP